MLVITEDKLMKFQPFYEALGIEFLELQGMDIEGKNYQILITPTYTQNAVQELEKGSLANIKGAENNAEV